MKKIFTSILFIILCFKVYSQKFNVDTLYKTGSIERRLNVVILGDGFTQEELPTFRAEAKKFADFFLGYEPYNRYRDYFNFVAIPTPSKESGVTNPGTAPDAYPDQPVGVRDTFYGATFGTVTHRGVYVTKYNVVNNVLAYNFPAYDLVVIIVNTPFYGGTGGSYAVHTLHHSANTIGAHEIGHTLTHLADEYWPGGGWETSNMTQNGNPVSVRWKKWLGEFDVQTYPHGTEGDAKKWFKPTNGRCLMEYLSQQMCAVCKEATTETILSQVSPVDKIEPDTAGILPLNSPKVFKLGLLKPQPNTLLVEWRMNGELIKKGLDEITLDPPNNRINSILTATVFDSTKLSRRDDTRKQRTWAVQWDMKSDGFRVTSSAGKVCAGIALSLTAAGCAGAITWSTGGSGSSIIVNPTQSRIYNAYCKVPGRATDSAAVHIEVLALPVATASNSGPYLTGADIVLSASGGSTYNWTGPASFVSTAQSPVIPNSKTTNSGIYTVNVTNQNGCSASAQTQVQVDPILGVGREAAEIVTVSPNPTKDMIKVQTKLTGRSEITIYDLNGRKLQTRAFQGTTEIKMNSSPGVYLYRFSNADREVGGKVVVQ